MEVLLDLRKGCGTSQLAGFLLVIIGTSSVILATLLSLAASVDATKAPLSVAACDPPSVLSSSCVSCTFSRCI